MNAKIFLTTVSVCALLCGSAFANAKDSALNKSGSPVVTKSGNCVLTKWDGSDKCAPAPAPAPEPAPAPAPEPKVEIQYEKRVVYFDFNDARLTGAGVTKLDELIEIMSGYTNIVKAEVVGFADEIGTNEANYKLAERRSFAVRDYIASRTNIPVEAMGVRSIGEDAPTAQCGGIKNRIKKIECLGPDRRVEVEFTYEK